VEMPRFLSLGAGFRVARSLAFRAQNTGAATGGQSPWSEATTYEAPSIELRNSQGVADVMDFVRQLPVDVARVREPDSPLSSAVRRSSRDGITVLDSLVAAIRTYRALTADSGTKAQQRRQRYVVPTGVESRNTAGGGLPLAESR
jgi:hypothetical protein